MGKTKMWGICAAITAAMVALGGCAAKIDTKPVEPVDSASTQSSVEPVEPEDSVSSEQEESGGNETAEKVEISLEDVVAMAKEEADQYYDNLRLTEVHSYDNDAERSMTAGEDGCREWWYVNFANEELNYVSILISGGEMTVHAFDENGNNGLFDLSEVQMTAKEAVEKAKQLGLRGGNPENDEEWVSGFNFKLSCGSLVQTPEDVRLFFEVIGISPDGNFAQVDFDGKTGELLLAEEQIEDENGNLEWRTFGA